MRERKHFIAIAVMIFVLTLLFQYSAIIKGNSIDYATNHAMELSGPMGQIPSSRAFNPSSEHENSPYEPERRHVVFIGPNSSPYHLAAREFAAYSKWHFDESFDLGSWILRDPLSSGTNWGLVVIDPAYARWPDDVALVSEIQRAGIPVVLCGLPDRALIEKSDELKAVLGIADVRQSSVELTGLHLFEGLLLGGAKVYEATPEDEHVLDGIELEAPWYEMAGGSKVYLRGEVDTDVYEDTYAHDELIPPLMWRHSEGDAPLYVAYAPILTKVGGFGLLSAFVAETYSYELWPVANVQVFALYDYPVLARENDDEMQRIYARDSVAVQRDVVWGSLSALVKQSGSAPTFLAVPELTTGNADSPSRELLLFYMRTIDELNGEVGLSCDTLEGGTSPEKIKDDMAYLRQEVPGYTFSVAGVRSQDDFEALRSLGAQLSDVRTLVSTPQAKWPVVDYVSGSVVRLNALSGCRDLNAIDDFALRASETGFGYSCVTFDLKGVTHPESDDDQWQAGYRKMLANYSTSWKPFRHLRQVSATEGGAYVRQALSADYSKHREDNRISIACDTASDVSGMCFYLRLHDEHVVSAEGCAFQELEDDYYVLMLSENEASVTVASDMQPTVVR